MQEKLLKLLGNGIPANIAALSCGVSPSYVSQLMSDSDFAAKLSELKVTNLTAATDRDARLDKIEDLAIEKMEQLIPYVTKPMEVTRIFQTINGAKRRGAGAQNVDSPTTQQFIQLNMPVKIVNNFKLTERREVIEVNGQTMVSMQAPALMQMVRDRAESSKGGFLNATPNSNTEAANETNNGAKDNSVASALA